MLLEQPEELATAQDICRLDRLVALSGLASVWNEDLLTKAGTMLVGAFLGLIAAALCLILTYFLLPKRARRSFRQHKSLHGEVKLRWDESEITFETAQAFSRHQWSDFVKSAENRHVVLFFQTDNLFNFIPKRVLGQDAIASLHVLRTRPAP